MDTELHASESEVSPDGAGRNLAPELIGLILSELAGDVVTLRTCTLLCSTWAALSRPYLFRKVVCRPAVPTRTWDDLSLFLTATPSVARDIRWLTFDGEVPNSRGNVSNIVVEDILEALERLPCLTRLYIRKTRFYSAALGPAAAQSDNTQSTSTLSARLLQRPVSLEMLSIDTCPVHTLMSLHNLLASIAHIETFALYHFLLFGLFYLPPASMAVRISTIHVDGAFPLGGPFWASFRQALAPGAASNLCISSRLVGGRVAVSPLLEVLRTFGTDVHSVALNVLGGSCDLLYVVQGSVREGVQHCSDGATPPSSPGLLNFPHIDLSPFVSIRQVTLYFTTTSVKTGREATHLYARLLANNWAVLSHAPTSLAHIELCFQRYGSHTPTMLDDLRAIDELYTSPEQVKWSTVDERTLARFPDLETFTCVLCDGGFVDQYGPFECAEVDASAPAPRCSREQEFEGYVEFLRGAFPRLLERGILRFRMSEV